MRRVLYLKNDLSLCRVSLQFSQKKPCSFMSSVLLGRCEVLLLSHLVGRQLEIVLHDVPHRGYGRIYVFNHLSRRSLRVLSHPFLNSFNHLLCSSTKFLKSVHNMTHGGFCHLQEPDNLRVCPSRAMKLNYGLSFGHLEI